jgi:hypothetical protein
MRESVTKLTRQRSFATIKIIAKAMLDGEECVSYSDLAYRLGMPNTSGQGLGPILDDAARQCMKFGLPDVSAVVVSKESILAGRPMPSERSFDQDGFWPITGTHRDEIPEIQDRVRRFEWRKVRSLGLG